jgi:hypothetical protein
MKKSLQIQLAALRARYDTGAVSPAVAAIIKSIEIDLAWLEHDQAPIGVVDTDNPAIPASNRP